MKKLLAVLMLFIASLASADEDDVKGCYVTYNPQTGKFAYEPFLKTRDSEYTSEDGEPEVWGVRPWSEAARKDGKPIEVNVADNRFIPLNTLKEVKAGTTSRRIKCPDGFW